ncbi:MAG: hypothetical protein HXK71_06650 [Clostridiales bacterium]|nr:hypothetical protein [Clostridiales bacterium]
MSKLVELNAKLPQKIEAKSEAREAEIIAKKIANGEYSGTFIDGKKIYSPEIYGKEISVVPTTSGEGSFNIYGKYGSDMKHMFAISYWNASSNPLVCLYSPVGAYLHIGNSKQLTYIEGTIDFSGASVRGLNTNATFG